jgi:hypothetical protein
MRAYRLLTAEDTSAFCHKVTEALAKGWELYGSPAYAFDAATGAMPPARRTPLDGASGAPPEDILKRKKTGTRATPQRRMFWSGWGDSR